MNYTMEHNGYKASIMEAERLTGDGEHGLPPGNSLPIYRTTEFKKHPENWMEEDGCFVVPVRPNRGLWFDWRDNENINTAVIPTVKGCNPITGLKTEGFALERYEKKCPKHNIKFLQDRYCDKCGFKWPAQNYITSPNIMWWDGFRATDGTVRQFFFTEDMMRDIAAHMIGKENTVPAFGFAFYEPVKRRVAPITIHSTPGSSIDWMEYSFDGTDPLHGGNSHVIGGVLNGGGCQLDNLSLNFDSQDLSHTISGKDTSPNVYYTSANAGESTMDIMQTSNKLNGLSMSKKKVSNVNLSRGIQNHPKAKQRMVVKKEVAVGAGAKIKQTLAPDAYELESWKNDPGSVMRLYFVFQDEFNHWKSFGMKDIDGKSTGMLDSLPVG